MSDQQPSGTGRQPSGTGRQPTGQQQGGTGQQPYGGYGAFPTSIQVPQRSSGISFKVGELDAASGKINGQAALIDVLRAKSSHMGVPFPSFGTIGIGITRAHDKAIAAQSAALERGKKALQSWQAALKKADANYHEAETSDYGMWRNEEEIDSGAGGVPTPKMPTVPDTNLPGGDLPGGDLPDTDLPGTDLPGTDRPGGDLPRGDLPGTDRPTTDVPGADLPGVDRPDSDLPGGNDPNMKVPDIDSALNEPQDKTGLSSFDPRTQQLNGVPNPNLTDLSTRPGTAFGSPTGSGAGSDGGAGAGLRGQGGLGTPGGLGSGMPMAPMMPMSGASSDERDREQGSLLSEDEGVWGDDEDIAPEIIGKEK